MADLHVRVGDRECSAEWTGESPETRAAIEAALPIEGETTRWGDELYFRTGVDAPPEDAREEVPVGAVAYWSRGNAVCLFWGPTPASVGDEPRAASPVNVVAQVADTGVFEGVEDRARVRIERA
jgi:hypothetical protein